MIENLLQKTLRSEPGIVLFHSILEKIMSEKTMIIQGNPISPGLAEGKIHVHRTLLGPIDVVPQGDGRHNVNEKLGNLDLATSKITDDLLSLALHVEKEIDTRLSKVFEVHQLILHDASLRKELRQEIVQLKRLGQTLWYRL